MFSLNFSNPEDIKTTDFKSALHVDLSQSCLYPTLMFPNNTFDGSNVYVKLSIGQGCKELTQPDQGIYQLDLKNNTSIRITTDQDMDEDDWILAAP